MPEAVKLAAQKIKRSKKTRILAGARQEYTEEARRLNRRLVNDEITVEVWKSEMMVLVKNVNTAAYVAGKSGEWESMTDQDWGRTGPIIRRQYGFIRKWAGEILSQKEFSLAQLNARAELYAEAASQSFERGYQSEIGMDPSVLPAHPGDGSTRCLARCNCRWAITIKSKARGDYNATWTLGNAEHCRTCRQRRRHWYAVTGSSAATNQFLQTTRWRAVSPYLRRSGGAFAASWSASCRRTSRGALTVFMCRRLPKVGRYTQRYPLIPA